MRLLVVEDEARIAEAIKRALELHHYAVDIVHDADSGLSAAAHPDYDMVILDRMLPGSLDGIGIAKELRNQGVDTPIIMLTALSEVDDRIDGLRAGADDYLQKPFSMKELIARVQTLFRRPRYTLGTTLKVDDLHYDPVTFRTTRSGKQLSLSTKETKLLEYMLYNQGQVISKDRIIAHVWDEDALIMPNTVEVYMGYLRKKIDTNFPDRPPLVHTIRGFGYRIGATT